MLMDRWYRVAIPILEYVQENSDPEDSLSVGQIASGTGLGPEDVKIELERLVDAGYLVGDFRKYIGSSPSSWNIFSCSLSERGLRGVDAWPSDNPYDPLIQMIERQTELIERLTQVVIQRQRDLMIERRRDLMTERQIATTPDEAALSKQAALSESVMDLGKASIVGLRFQVDRQRVSLQTHLGLNPLSHLRCSRLVSAVNNIRDLLLPDRM